MSFLSKSASCALFGLDVLSFFAIIFGPYFKAILCVDKSSGSAHELREGWGGVDESLVDIEVMFFVDRVDFFWGWEVVAESWCFGIE